MLALLMAALLTATKSDVPCRRSLGVTPKGYVCVEYAAKNGVVVYALEQSPPLESDFEHKVFVALVRQSVIDRIDVTKRMLDMGERNGTFMWMDAVIRPFEIAGRTVVDIELSSTLSGTGSVTVGSDLIAEIDSAHLHEIAFLQGTSGFARGGWGYLSETNSKLFARGRELLWIRRSSKGTSTSSDDPLIVHCNIERRLYRYTNRNLEYIGRIRASDPREKRMRMLNSSKTPAFLPCCAGCEFRGIH